MNQVNVKIKDIEWQISVLEDCKYEEEHGRDSHGVTVKDDLKVDLKKSSFSLRLVLHELFHVYVSSCCINSMSDISCDDMEELGAEIVEFHSQDIMSNAKKIFNSLKRKVITESKSG